MCLGVCVRVWSHGSNGTLKGTLHKSELPFGTPQYDSVVSHSVVCDQAFELPAKLWPRPHRKNGGRAAVVCVCE